MFLYRWLAEKVVCRLWGHQWNDHGGRTFWRYCKRCSARCWSTHWEAELRRRK